MIIQLESSQLWPGFLFIKLSLRLKSALQRCCETIRFKSFNLKEDKTANFLEERSLSWPAPINHLCWFKEDINMS